MRREGPAGPMLHRLLTYEVRKESLPQAVALAQAFIDEVTRKEGGTARYVAFQETAQPTRFVHHMTFRVQSAEDYHLKTAWRKRFVEALQPMCSSPPLVTALTPVAGG